MFARHDEKYPFPKEVCRLRIPYVLLLIHVSLLAWQAQRDSETWDEVGHLAAGLSHWYYGDFTLYRVNPPLVRLIATAPIALFSPTVPIHRYSTFPERFSREDFVCGSLLAVSLGRLYPQMITRARWMCIPFSILGFVVCGRWANELYGHCSSIIVQVIWAFSPTVLAYGHLITPDVAAASTGVLAAYLFWHWLQSPRWIAALFAGVALGLATLTKSTFIVFFGLWPITWLFYEQTSRRYLRDGVPQLCFVSVTALFILNAGYGFRGTFKPLGEYQFCSIALGGTAIQSKAIEINPAIVRGPRGEKVFASGVNRFSNSLLSKIRVPLPEDYLRGIDFVKMEYERKYWSYLRGELRLGGWWHYYLYAMLVKEPEGTWLLGLMTMSVTLFGRKIYNSTLSNEFVVLLPAIAIIVLVSSQTGFNHHLRYVLAAYPFLFIWMSKMARSFTVEGRLHQALSIGTVLALSWSTISSLSVVPHSMSYFNAMSGGPGNGTKHLANSNTDWGQDLLYLQTWYERNLKARPLYLGYDLPLIDPKILGIDWHPLPVGPMAEGLIGQNPEEVGPFPGWYAVSVNWMLDGQHRWDYFKELTPVDWVGYTMPIYHITLEQANTMRRKYGMPLLPLTPPTTQPTPTTSETLGGTHDRDR